MTAYFRFTVGFLCCWCWSPEMKCDTQKNQWALTHAQVSRCTFQMGSCISRLWTPFVWGIYQLWTLDKLSLLLWAWDSRVCEIIHRFQFEIGKRVCSIRRMHDTNHTLWIANLFTFIITQQFNVCDQVSFCVDCRFHLIWFDFICWFCFFSHSHEIKSQLNAEAKWRVATVALVCYHHW